MKKIMLILVVIFGLVGIEPFFVVPAQADTLADQSDLQKQLNDIETQIVALEKQLATTKGQKRTLANKIKQLQKEQAALKLKIQQTSLALQSVQKKLSSTKNSISLNEAKKERLLGELTILLRLMDKKDRELFLFKFIGDGGLGGAFVEIKNYQALSMDINALVQRVKDIEEQLDNQKKAYENQKEDTQQLLELTKLQQSALTDKLGEQHTLLTETQGKESTFQSQLDDSKKRAAEIRNRLYELLGVGTQINFGQAVTIASWVEGQTNVPAAFLLAILTQESNLGKNVGTCNRPGDPPEKGWKVIMKPDRDQEPFKTITSELGRNPDITPVSCPMKDKNGNQFGWGGAMGPAQFIPSTWMGYRAKVASMSGKVLADPWDIRDAFLAASLLLKNNGADTTSDGQWKAAMRYFSGGTNTRYRFYGDNVLSLTAKYEQDIKDLKN